MAADSQGSYRSGLSAGLAAVVLWCFTGLCFAGGARQMGPMLFLCGISLVGAATGVALHLAARRPLRSLYQLPARVWLIGVPGISIYSALFILAVGLAPAGAVAQVTLVNYLWPVMVVLFDLVLVPDTRRTRRSVAMALVGAALGLVGVAISRGLSNLTLTGAALLPQTMALAGAAMWALYTVMLRRWRVPADQTGSTGQWLICAALAAGLATLRGEWSDIHHITPSALGWLVACGVGPVGLGYALWEYGIKTGPARLLAVASFCIPVVSAIALGLAYRECLDPMLAPGAGLIATGAWLARRAEAVEG